MGLGSVDTGAEHLTAFDGNETPWAYRIPRMEMEALWCGKHDEAKPPNPNPAFLSLPFNLNIFTTHFVMTS